MTGLYLRLVICACGSSAIPAAAQLHGNRGIGRILADKRAQQQVKQAIFSRGAGQQGEYSECCWQCSGTGQFKPGSGSSPYLGEVGELKRVSELRIETLVAAADAKAVVAALREAHPYEEPALELVALVAEHDLHG